MDKIKNILEEILEVEVNENISMDNCEEWDSANHVFIILELQEVFDTKIPVDMIDKLRSYNDIKKFLNL